MDTQAIRAQMRTLVVGHVPSNVRSFKFNIFDGEPKVSTSDAVSTVSARTRPRSTPSSPPTASRTECGHPI